MMVSRSGNKPILDRIDDNLDLPINNLYHSLLIYMVYQSSVFNFVFRLHIPRHS